MRSLKQSTLDDWCRINTSRNSSLATEHRRKHESETNSSKLNLKQTTLECWVKRAKNIRKRSRRSSRRKIENIIPTTIVNEIATVETLMERWLGIPAGTRRRLPVRPDGQRGGRSYIQTTIPVLNGIVYLNGIINEAA